MKLIDADKLRAEVERRRLQNRYIDTDGYEQELFEIIDSLQQEQPEVELEKTVEFECIGKNVKMTIQELINYYIDTECAEVADECGF